MPTETFLNLNKDKQTRVYEALFSEYSRVPLEEVSVKNIITTADIPRGSFYQYFIDKEEALTYLISQTRDQEQLEYDFSDLNIYQLIEFIFMREVNKLKKQEESDRVLLLKQIVKSTKATSIFYNVMIDSVFNNLIFEKCWNNTMSNTDKKLKKNTFDLLFATLKDCLVVAIEDENKIDDCIEDFKLKIEIIRLGIDNIIKK